MTKKTAPLSLRLDPDLKAALQKRAEAENRSLTNFIETELKRIAAERVDAAEAAGQLKPAKSEKPTKGGKR